LANPVREADDLRCAIESGNFEKAPELIEAYGRSIQRHLETARSAEERLTIAKEARAFLTDRLSLAQVLRAHIGAQWRAASGLAHYQNDPTPQRSWELDG
jgi:hypothetical protein